MKTAAHALAHNLRSRRQQLGFTQERLAELSGLSEIYIREIEGMKKYPGTDTLAKLAKALKIKETTLFFDPDIVGLEQVIAVLKKHLK